VTAATRPRGDRATARRFARSWLRVELACVLSRNDFRRPSTCLIALVAAIVTAQLTSILLLLVESTPLALLLALVLGTALALTLYSVTASWVEGRNFAVAPHRWLMHVDQGVAGGYARPDRRGRMTLYCVWAYPRGQQVGSKLMRQVCADMDASGCDLYLVAVNRRVAAFYRHFGFETVSSGPLGVRMHRPAMKANSVVDCNQHRG
jgi:ribosomal protein S18 acetylase RimI-like enzyme